jgi:hypothetical protein
MATWRLLTESGDYLITEAGDSLIQETLASDLLSESSVSADLYVVIGFEAALVCESSVTASVTTSIDLGASLEASSSIEAEVIFYRPLNAELESASSIVADITTVISLHAGLEAASSITATLSTSINAIAALVAISNLVDANLTVLRRETRYLKRANYIYLAEITAYDTSTSSEITWRFSSGAGYNNAGVFYKPRIENPATFQRSITAGIGGKASVSYGELTLSNLDGELNDLANDYFDGRTLTLKRGKKTDPYEDFATLMIATVESAAMERERVSIRLRDKTYLLNKPFNESRYAGTNTLPNGLEGTADDIKGQAKPKIYGRIALMQPVLVNTSKLIYQVNDGAIDAVINVFDSGAYLSRGTNYASEAEMFSTAPLAGEWRAYPAGGYFRLGTSAFGVVGACVAEKWAYLDCSAAGIIERILTDAGFTSDNWVSADFTALDRKNAGSLGVIVQDGETTEALIDRICQSVGAWWGVDSLNRIRFARLDEPSGVSSALITDNEIIEIERLPEQKFAVWQETVKSDTNYLPLERTALAGVVPDDRANWFVSATRDQVAEDAGVKTTRLLSESELYDTSLNGISIAKAEADRRLSLFSSRRDTVTLTVGDPINNYASIDLGNVVTVASGQLGYQAGRQMVVTSIRPDYQSNTFDITLWG